MDLNCLICAGQVLTVPDNHDYIAEQESHCHTMWKLLSLSNQLFISTSDSEFQGSFFCYTCNKTIEKVQVTMDKLDRIQFKLNKFREEIQSAILNTYDLKIKSSTLSISDEFRNKIVPNLQRNESDIPVNSPMVMVKEEQQDFQPANFPSYLDDDFQNIDYSFSPPSSPTFSATETYNAQSVDTDSQQINNALTNTKFLKLYIKLRRIEEEYPDLKNQNSIQLNSRQGPVLEDSGILPLDPTDPNLYKIPSRCKIEGCKSQVIFDRRCKLTYHINEVHLWKDSSNFPFDLTPYGTFPARCLQPDCTSEALFKNMYQVRRHLMSVHGPTRQKQSKTETSQMIWDQVTYPTKCPMEGCTCRIALFTSRYSLRRHIKRTHFKERKRGPPLEDSGILPLDPTDPNLYKIPSRCRIEGCNSEVIFDMRSKLTYHINEVHLWKDSSNFAFDLTPYDTFPARCLQPDCTSEALFKNMYQVRRHLMSVHDPKREKQRKTETSKMIWNQVTSYPTKCPIEGCTCRIPLFNSRYSLKRHIQRTHFKERKPAKIDQLKFPAACYHDDCPSDIFYDNRTHLKDHIAEVHGKRGQGKVPPKPRKERGRPRNIKKETQQKSIMCELCGIVVKSSKAIENHMRVHNNDLLKCDSCDAQFRSKHGLKEHIKTYHSTTTEIFKCHLCPKTFKLQPFLRNHIWRHTNHKRKVCELCNERFMFKIDLEDHRRYKHYKELGLEPFQCQFCQKIYSRQSTLNIHMRSHLGTDLYVCEICQYKTSRKKDYDEHMSTVHSAACPFTCDVCGKSFKLERRLKEHMNYHKDDYQFQCQLCQRRCSSGHTLKVHLRKKHTKEELANHSKRQIESIEEEDEESNMEFEVSNESSSNGIDNGSYTATTVSNVADNCSFQVVSSSSIEQPEAFNNSQTQIDELPVASDQITINFSNF